MPGMRSPAPLPVLYSFRRCPYAMRARVTLWYAGIRVELREVVLRDKPPEMIRVSSKATVPVLEFPDGRVIDESEDIMRWALSVNDPDNWLSAAAGDTAVLIRRCDFEFKPQLDRYKYAERYPDADAASSRSEALEFLDELDQRLAGQPYLLGPDRSMADVAVAPFVRQFAGVDRDWFAGHLGAGLTDWLARFEASAEFRAVMKKYPQWHAGDPVTVFDPAAAG